MKILVYSPDPDLLRELQDVLLPLALENKHRIFLEKNYVNVMGTLEHQNLLDNPDNYDLLISDIDLDDGGKFDATYMKKHVLSECLGLKVLILDTVESKKSLADGASTHKYPLTHLFLELVLLAKDCRNQKEFDNAVRERKRQEFDSIFP